MSKNLINYKVIVDSANDTDVKLLIREDATNRLCTSISIPIKHCEICGAPVFDYQQDHYICETCYDIAKRYNNIYDKILDKTLDTKAEPVKIPNSTIKDKNNLIFRYYGLPNIQITDFDKLYNRKAQEMLIGKNKVFSEMYLALVVQLFNDFGDAISEWSTATGLSIKTCQYLIYVLVKLGIVNRIGSGYKLNPNFKYKILTPKGVSEYYSRSIKF